MAKKEWNVYLPPLSLTTDNAAMIALAGAFKYEKGIFGHLQSHAQSRMSY
jgi:N6-L-threonylcarbamoyladenine synthase